MRLRWANAIRSSITSGLGSIFILVGIMFMTMTTLFVKKYLLNIKYLFFFLINFKFNRYLIKF